MPVKIRLQRHGRKQRPFYHIVVADSRTTRNGKFIERIGEYNPLTIPATINVDAERAFEWVMNGAQPTDTVRKILTFKGVMFRKHLQRGVAKGALTQEKADTMYADWVASKNAKVQERMDKEIAKMEEKRLRRVNAEAEKRTAKMLAKEEAAKAVEAEAVAEAAEAVEGAAEEVATEATETVEEVATEATEAVEEAAEVVEEAATEVAETPAEEAAPEEPAAEAPEETKE